VRFREFLVDEQTHNTPDQVQCVHENESHVRREREKEEHSEGE